MRVYEYAKKHGLTSKDVLQLLHDKGVNLSSHMAVIPPEALASLSTQKSSAKPAVKKEVAPSVKVPPEKPRLTPAQEPLSTKVVADREQAKPIPPQSSMPQKPPLISEEKKITTPSVPQKISPEVKQSSVAVPPEERRSPEPKVIISMEIDRQSMTVADFAEKTKKPIGDVILTLLRQGVVAAKNQVLTVKNVEQLATIYSLKLKEAVQKQADEGPRPIVQSGEERLPVVVVIGHVDHGKTTLLDFIRKTRVASREHGGITQHLGAYEAHTKHGDLIFLDTPGHEAFSKMRQRGARVADLAILVVAADDGVMPQTVEALKQAQAVKIPIIVAINKIDKATSAQIDAVKRSLTQYGLVPEEWGGETVCLPISAKFGTGVDALLEVLVLQSKLMELKADLESPASGYVLEAKKERGLGNVATVLDQNGILRVGDSFIAGDVTGRVTSLLDSWGKRLTEARPSQPVLVAGFDELPQVGVPFQVISAAEIKKVRQEGRKESTRVFSGVSSEEGINVILKADNNSTREAIIDALKKVNEKAFKKLHVLSSGIGDVVESDVQRAHDTGSMIYTLHSKVEPNAHVLAVKYGVEIRQFEIIYKLIEDFDQLSHAGKPIKKVKKKIGEATVLKVFDIKGLGIVAGAQVKSGRLLKDAPVVIWRGKHKIGEGVIKSLQKEKKVIKEATVGHECAFLVDGFYSWEPDDRVECFQEVAEG